VSLKWELPVGIAGTLILLGGHALGLFVAPSEAAMGETGRILYAHVPSAWTGLLALTTAFVGAVGALWNGKRGWDALQEAGVEVGVLFCAMLLVQGSLWAKPTWGTFWTWDPRLTTTAILFVAFCGVLVLRRLIDQFERRMTATAVATIVSFVDVPVVFLSVKWWKTLHQPISEQGSIDAAMLRTMLVSFVGMTLLAAAFIGARWRIALTRLDRELAGSDLPDAPLPLDLREGGPGQEVGP
jgi:heme exporter protein C